MNALNRTELESLYKKEPDPFVKERLLLVLRIEYGDIVPARVARELHRSRTWASDWLARYDNEGVDGLRNRPKSGRSPQISLKVVLKIRKRLTESRQGWTTKQVNDIIVQEGGIKYHYVHIYRLLHKWDSNKKYLERYMSILHLRKKKMLSKKNTENTRQFT
jgi:putative transposase